MRDFVQNVQFFFVRKNDFAEFFADNPPVRVKNVFAESLCNFADTFFACFVYSVRGFVKVDNVKPVFVKNFGCFCLRPTRPLCR